jgi:hypothetical protein
VYASAIAFLVGVPLFTLLNPPGWTPIWAFLLGTSAVLCTIGSITDRWRKLETYAGFVLCSMIFAYVVGMNLVAYVYGDLARQFVGTIAVIAAVLPFTRFVYLLAQMGKKHVEPQ